MAMRNHLTAAYLKTLIKSTLPLTDLIMAPAVYIAALLLKAVRRAGVRKMPFCKKALIQVGVFPIRNHYYEPLFDARLLRKPLDEPRSLPGVDWNTGEQLRLLKSFCFSHELEGLPPAGTDALTFNMSNSAFGAGDAEYLYNLIRLKRPRRIVEIGSGNSTLVAIMAIRKNEQADHDYKCDHLCIEPFEMPWLEKTGVTVIRQAVERVDRAIFSALEKDDILFIDSSHMIRPQGDVLVEYLEVIPSLKVGVIVHVHDIMSPRDYPKAWVVDDVRFWNEQYLVEAFLTCNREWKVIGALNFLHHNYYDQLASVCPFLMQKGEPGSLYIQKTAA